MRALKYKMGRHMDGILKCALAAFFSALALAGCAKKKNTSFSALPDEVEVAFPLAADVEITGRYSARLRANQDVEIRARVGGYLEKVYFEKGAKVRGGDVLFKIDDRPYAAALAAAEAVVEAAKSKIKLAEDNAERARGLFKRNAISKEAWQTRETELLIAKAKLLEAEASARNARLNLEYTCVRAPVAGRVGENFSDVGNLIAAHATKLARLVDDSSVKAYFELNGSDAVRYKNSGILRDIDSQNGAKVEVSMKGDDKIYFGRLCYYDNVLGAGTGSLVVRADIENSGGGLITGGFGNLRVFEGVAKGALLVPEEAVGTDLGGRYVLAVDGEGKVRQIPVVVGSYYKGFRVIESGVDKNTRVIVKGLQRAVPGRKVKPVQTEIKLPENAG